MGMTFEQVLRARAHRILRGLTGYHHLPTGVTPAVVTSMRDDEAVLGLYKNTEDIRDNVVITSKGVHLFAGGWILLHYAQMRSTHVLLDEHRDKRAADTIVLHMQSGQEFRLRFLGGDDKTRDVWALERFFLRVIVDYRARHRQAAQRMFTPFINER